MQLNETCLKIDKPNAKAMIYGFQKAGKLTRQSIWLAVKDRPELPELLTFNRFPSRFSPLLSRTGKELDAENSSIPFKYIAEFQEQYFIKNKMELWEKVCSNGLFDIWDPKAPFKRFDESESSESKFRIQLLRIYEIDHKFNNNEIKPAGDHLDKLIQPSREVSTISAVISNADFFKLKKLLEDSVAPYRIPLQMT